VTPPPDATALPPNVEDENRFTLQVEDTTNHDSFYYLIRFLSNGDVVSTTHPIVPVTPTSSIQPYIHNQPGLNYEKIFTIVEGGKENVRFFRGAENSILGPNAIALLPDDNFLIADPVDNRLLRFNQSGELVDVIQLESLGVRNVSDMRVKDGIIFLMGATGENYFISSLTADGKLLRTEHVPEGIFLQEEIPLEAGLSGIAVDCNGDILLEINNGVRLYPLEEIRQTRNLSSILPGFACNNKRYQVDRYTPSKITTEDAVYRTDLTTPLGSLYILDVLQDGGIYIIREDLLGDQPGSKIDQTVHYISGNGSLQGIARMPYSEFYYPIKRSIAISKSGDIFALLPHSNSVDVIHLNFYKQLEPLLPGAVTPQIIVDGTVP